MSRRSTSCPCTSDRNAAEHHGADRLHGQCRQRRGHAIPSPARSNRASLTTLLSYNHGSVDSNQIAPPFPQHTRPVADDNAHRLLLPAMQGHQRGHERLRGWSTTSADGTIGSATTDKCCACAADVRDPPISYRVATSTAAPSRHMTDWIDESGDCTQHIRHTLLDDDQRAPPSPSGRRAQTRQAFKNRPRRRSNPRTWGV